MNQLRLYTEVVAPLPPRPLISDPAVKAAAMDALTGEVCQWMNVSTDTDRTEIRNELEICFDEDGYQFAKNLDRRFLWDVSAELVEILDRYEMHLHNAHDKAVQAWRERNQISDEEMLELNGGSRGRWSTCKKDRNDSRT
jgi:hypothetical protein